MSRELSDSLSNLAPEQRKELEEKLKKMSPEQLQELQKQQCIFCQILAGKVPSKKIYEDEVCTVIIDINPASKGHLLIMPKEHYAIMPQIPEEVVGHLFLVCKHLSKALLKALKAEGTNIFIANGPAAGQRAQHTIIHLIPRKEGDLVLDLQEKLFDEEMLEKVKGAVESKLKEVLGVGKAVEEAIEEQESKKKEVKRAEREEDHTEEKEIIPLHRKRGPGEEEFFITSLTAKRYHQERCAFAQNIPADKRIVFAKEEASKSGLKPCTCVTGKKIHLKTTESKIRKERKKTKTKTKKQPLERHKKQSEKKHQKQHQKQNENHTKKHTKKQREEQLQKKEGFVSLDDIADLFK
ncbi:MAG: HIT domain-containing protein [Nanoarchaeota archaeon]|nr:HIT domain-containing protein [Nanoarchaeota archaeon]